MKTEEKKTNIRRHATDRERRFLGWIPEISDKIFDHLKVKKIIVLVEGKDGEGDASYVYYRNGGSENVEVH